MRNNARHELRLGASKQVVTEDGPSQHALQEKCVLDSEPRPTKKNLHRTVSCLHTTLLPYVHTLSIDMPDDDAEKSSYLRWIL